MQKQFCGHCGSKTAQAEVVTSADALKRVTKMYTSLSAFIDIAKKRSAALHKQDIASDILPAFSFVLDRLKGLQRGMIRIIPIFQSLAKGEALDVEQSARLKKTLEVETAYLKFIDKKIPELQKAFKDDPDAKIFLKGLLKVTDEFKQLLDMD